jgi:tetratricopeptide (TPR) repeat protein
MDRHHELVDFLAAADDLVTTDDDLALLKAWSLFHIGSLVRAKIINDRLRQARHDPNDARLEINLAMAMGTWENFPDIVTREWAERDNREPRYLVRLAQLAADFDKDRAIELTREATRKASDSPEVLAAASLLAYRLGQDDEAMPWMVEAGIRQTTWSRITWAGFGNWPPTTSNTRSSTRSQSNSLFWNLHHQISCPGSFASQAAEAGN